MTAERPHMSLGGKAQLQQDSLWIKLKYNHHALIFNFVNNFIQINKKISGVYSQRF